MVKMGVIKSFVGPTQLTSPALAAGTQESAAAAPSSHASAAADGSCAGAPAAGCGGGNDGLCASDATTGPVTRAGSRTAAQAASPHRSIADRANISCFKPVKSRRVEHRIRLFEKSAAAWAAAEI